MPNFYYVLIGILSLIFVGKVSGFDSKIVGGNKAPPEYGKFHASLQNITGNHVCGGAVVSKWYVVTAAHCVYGAEIPYIKIVAGTNNLDVGGKQHDVVSVIIYDKYNSITKEHDIALLKTSKPFDLRYIQILELRRKELQENDKVVLVGFGAKEKNGESSRNMFTLELPVFNQEVCEYAMRYSTAPVTKEMFCTFTQIGEGTCHGDSGSPIIIGDELVGIVSWGIPCAVGFPDVHTRVSPYIEWIQKHIRQSYCYMPKKVIP